MRFLIMTGAVLGLIACPAALPAQTYTVAPIVDGTTPRPDGFGTFYPVTPSTDGNTIVFNHGDTCASCPAPDSVWAVDVPGGKLRMLVGAGAPLPGGGQFRSFDLSPIVKSGIVLFIGFDANSRPGLYAVPAAGGAVVKLVDTGSTIPGTPAAKFTSFDRAGFYHDGTTAVFTGRGSGVSGVYSVKLDGTSLARLADSHTPVNSDTCDTFPVQLYSKPSISNGHLAFLGQASSDYGVRFSALYTGPLSGGAASNCGGVPSPSAVNSLQWLPGATSHVQTVFDYAQMDGAALLFRATDGSSGFGGIFALNMVSGALSKIADSTTALPDFGAVAYFGNYTFAADAGNVVFQAHGAGGKSALFLASAGTIQRIAGTGDAAGSSALASVDAPGLGAIAGTAVVFTGANAASAHALYLATPAAAAGPAIQSVNNAASNQSGAIAPGEIVAVKGSGLGPAAGVPYALDSNGRLSNQVAGVQVFFDEFAAPLLYVSQAQVNAIVPYGVEGRASVQVTVRYQGAPPAAVAVAVTDSAPALISANSSGQGQGAILNFDGSSNSSSNPAAVGSMVQLWGTGEGQTDPPGVDGQFANGTYPKPRLALSVTVGGVPAEIGYQGAAPAAPAGLFQLNFKIPDGLPPGDQPVVVHSGAAASRADLTVAVR
ncbi:MAG: IPT/TIG domain-containing protein [Acidobacteriia bacterium]|nr:IPT/TIG domain-containing protein [Terriglobia bacterium]